MLSRAKATRPAPKNTNKPSSTMARRVSPKAMRPFNMERTFPYPSHSVAAWRAPSIRTRVGPLELGTRVWAPVLRWLVAQAQDENVPGTRPQTCAIRSDLMFSPSTQPALTGVRANAPLLHCNPSIERPGAGISPICPIWATFAAAAASRWLLYPGLGKSWLRRLRTLLVLRGGGVCCGSHRGDRDMIDSGSPVGHLNSVLPVRPRLRRLAPRQSTDVASALASGRWRPDLALGLAMVLTWPAFCCLCVMLAASLAHAADGAVAAPQGPVP